MLIKIKNLRLQTIIGVYDWEKKSHRELIINVEVETKNTKSTTSDKLSDAIDYAELTTKIKDLVLKSRYNLIEKLAAEVIKKIMQDSRIKRCKVEIDKMKTVEEVESFSVTIEKTKKSTGRK